jgi:hypothetical protein
MHHVEGERERESARERKRKRRKLDRSSTHTQLLSWSSYKHPTKKSLLTKYAAATPGAIALLSLNTFANIAAQPPRKGRKEPEGSRLDYKCPAGRLYICAQYRCPWRNAMGSYLSAPITKKVSWSGWHQPDIASASPFLFNPHATPRLLQPFERTGTVATLV